MMKKTFALKKNDCFEIQLSFQDLECIVSLRLLILSLTHYAIYYDSS